MADIFVSYRRSDSRWAAGRIGDRLRSAFGDSRVFLDTLAIEPGEDFVEAIGAKVEGCRVLLAIIGPHWLETLRARSGASNDFVRIELAQALERGVRIIPATIDDTSMPGQADLPEDLATLARRNAVSISADTFDTDMAPLIAFLQRFLGEVADDDGGRLAQEAEAPPPVEATNISAGTVSGLRLDHRTSFWKTSATGRRLYKIFVWLEGPASDLDRVERVVYELHSSFKNPRREIFDRSSNFQLRTNGWGPFGLKATVYTKTGDVLGRLTRQISIG